MGRAPSAGAHRSGRARSTGTPDRRRPITVVSIAASDSGGGAGIQADLLTFAAHGVHGATVLTAATAQNTRSVTGVEPLSARLVARQMDAVFEDLRPAAVKIGMLYDAPRIRAVATGLRRHRARNVVLDPVMIAKAGARLLSGAAVAALRRNLLPLADLVTPNIPEAEVLAGMRIRSDADRRVAAATIYEHGPRAVLVKGGHGRGAVVRDLLYDGRFFTQFTAPRIRTRATHGTGCTLSSAIAANLALGYPLEDAIVRAIRYLRAALERGYFPGKGFGVPRRVAS
ncbi:MAG TPA: bifunctional hydroxymethylpyrimidine kinase/phosphomethylpyrimidine kinase [Thermoanaerobaculia bacterium]|nr:bifunctional hydroxymethylpyrimidine kinase/phosphomethylpyrimidine kinase [Thermoanaerobaculia bacterium]